MLSLVMYLLCVYLVFKGVEILQIGLASNRENRRPGLIIGLLSLLACAAAAGVFGYLTTEQMLEAERQMRTIPQFPR